MTGAAELSPASLLAEAAAAADRSDAPEPPFLANLHRLLTSCASTARLNPVGADVLGRVTRRHLRNLLDIEAYTALHPEVVERTLAPPVVITGLPRTGTTLLHNLLALDPAHRVLRLWEGLRPVPDDGEGPEPEARRAQAQRWLDGFYTLVPAFRAIHPATADGPEECDALLQNTFASQHFDDMFDAQDYSAWLAGASLTTEYRHYARQLRILAGTSSSAGARWVLKSPSHLGHLDALAAALPGAVVVLCHRDPRETVPSHASLIHTLRRAYSDLADPAVAGQQALQRATTAAGRAMAVRAGGRGTGSTTFIDVSYRHLARDPVEAVGAVQELLGRPLDAAGEARIRQWVAANPQHRHGRHDYDLGRFGLTVDAVEAAFADYPGAFG